MNKIISVVSHSEEQVNEMFFKGRQAQKMWQQLDVRKRLTYITKLRKKLIEEQDQWIEIIKNETIKTPVDVITAELYTCANALKYYEKKAVSFLKKKKVATPMMFWGQSSYVNYEPLGLVAVFSPYNFPMQLSVIPAITALIAGNAVIIKPSEHTPRINQKLKEWYEVSGLPEHVIQIIEGDGLVGERVIKAQPDHIFFTGSQSIGRRVYQLASEFLIPCVLELSGNNPLIVCEDAHLQRAAHAAVWGAFMHSGQVCVSVERALVHTSIYDQFISEAIALTKQLKQGISDSDDLGGITTTQGWIKVRQQVEDALEKGAIVHIGGLEQVRPPFFPPTILSNVKDDMDVVKSETFGPILSIQTFTTEDEALQRANEGEYGLNGYIFSRDLNKAKALAERLMVGNCYINDVILNISNMNLPFGGVKGSGFGRYHAAEGLYTFCNIKSIMVNPGRKKRNVNWFPYGIETYQKLKQLLRLLFSR